MRIAVVHYHFRPGGVTRVVHNAVHSLQDSGTSLCVLGGHIPASFSVPCSTGEVKALAYGDEGFPSVAEETDALMASARSLLGGEPDVWHIHNHSLGKNPVTHLITAELARRGAPLLLQIHDFAEDGRPGNVMRLRRGDSVRPLEKSLYPLGPHVHYAVLNGRDAGVLTDAGIPWDRIHFLPNAVDLTLEPPKDVPLNADRLLLYPTRGIRRKNIGEVLLWAAAAEPGERFGCTLAPENPEAQPIYDAWVHCAEELDLPVDFNLGRDYGFSDLLHAADWILTTSVAEGFGLAYLEPALIPRPVTGRDLPAVTRDFKDRGIRLPYLYESIPIPLDLLDEQALRADIRESRSRSLLHMGREPSEEDLQAVEHHLLGDGQVDFGVLSESWQRDVIQAVHRGIYTPQQPPWRQPVDMAVLQQDREAVETGYSLPAYGERLKDLYSLIQSGQERTIEGWVHPDRVMDAFLAPEQFNLLRCS